MKVLSLISGGIDSPVAAALALEQGTIVVFLHFQLYPYSHWQVENNTKEIVKALSKRFNRKLKLILVPFGKIGEDLIKGKQRKYQCILCRRMMLRAASEIGKRENAAAILTGESLGQVASQTLSNITAEQNAASLPVVRPLLGMDKLEIERLAKQFGTYNISIRPGGCCRLSPAKPATKSSMEKIREQEKNLNIERIIKNCLKNKEEIWIKN